MTIAVLRRHFATPPQTRALHSRPISARVLIGAAVRWRSAGSCPTVGTVVTSTDPATSHETTVRAAAHPALPGECPGDCNNPCDGDRPTAGRGPAARRPAGAAPADDRDRPGQVRVGRL